MPIIHFRVLSLREMCLQIQLCAESYVSTYCRIGNLFAEWFTTQQYYNVMMVVNQYQAAP